MYLAKFCRQIYNMRTTKRLKKSIDSVEIATNSLQRKENLPLPFVQYPKHYGVFIGFSEHTNSQEYFCLCSRRAIENCLKLHDKIEGGNLKEPLSDIDFPNTTVERSRIVSKLDELIQYKQKICHRCNLATPTITWCHKIYGGNFKQFYGWYIMQNQYKLGLSRFFTSNLKEDCPQEIILLIEQKKKLAKLAESAFENVMGTIQQVIIDDSPNNNEIRMKANEDYKALERARNRTIREIEKIPENMTREEFGFRKIGEGWVSETLLFTILKRIFPTDNIVRHARPNWLDNLELDIFLPDKSIAFEYQGQQHYFPIKAWGGKKALMELQRRDERKREMCKNNSVLLIEVDYTEPLTEGFICDKIRKSVANIELKNSGSSCFRI